jgi:hypothetical protein
MVFFQWKRPDYAENDKIWCFSMEEAGICGKVRKYGVFQWKRPDYAEKRKKVIKSDKMR